MKPDSIDWKNIPDTISKNSFCKICHMSKRTANLYLGTDVPCEDNGKTTHRYAIAKADIIDFLERTPERKRRPKRIPAFRCCKTAFCKSPLTGAVESFMREYYSNLLISEKDILNASDICRITGYGKTAVNNWFQSGYLIYVVIRNAKQTSKESLIDFMSSERFDKIYRKSDWHLKQIELLRQNAITDGMADNRKNMPE